MSTEKALNAIAEAIRNRGYSPTDRWFVVGRKGKFECIPAQQGGRIDSFLIKLTESQCLRGLSDREWDKIALKYVKFLSRRGK